MSNPFSDGDNSSVGEPSRVEAAKFQLILVLGLFPRVDTRASVLLGVNLGMLAFLASNVPGSPQLRWYLLYPSVPAVSLIGYSLYQLFYCAFPQLQGGSSSLIFFGEIAKRRESEYIDEFLKQSVPAYVKDLTAQTWRNAEILTLKYRHLKRAFVGMSLAIPFWVATLVLFFLANARTKLGPLP